MSKRRYSPPRDNTGFLFYPAMMNRYEEARGDLPNQWIAHSTTSEMPGLPPSGLPVARYKKCVERWIEIRQEMRENLGFKDIPVKLKAYSESNFGPMMLCRVDHTDPSVDTSQWETHYHGGNFY